MRWVVSFFFIGSGVRQGAKSPENTPRMKKRNRHDNGERKYGKKKEKRKRLIKNFFFFNHFFYIC